MTKDDIITISDAIITAALPHVPFDGWEQRVIQAAAEESGYDRGMVQAVFPGGISDVLAGFADLADRLMLAGLETLDPESLRVRDRVREAVLARLIALFPYKEAERLAILHWVMPWRKPHAAKILWRTADRIWHWAGDTSTDYNRYTKRGLLCGVLASTTLAWLNDTDPQMQETRAFLDRRIDNVLKLGALVPKFTAPKRRSAA